MGLKGGGSNSPPPPSVSWFSSTPARIGLSEHYAEVLELMF